VLPFYKILDSKMQRYAFSLNNPTILTEVHHSQTPIVVYFMIYFSKTR
jgi:hypothetical protein